MPRIVMMAVSITVWALASGCGQSAEQPENGEKSPESPAGNPTAKKDTDSEKVRKTVEIGCAKCMFKMKGVDSHELAVKIDGKPYLVSGVYIEPTEHGLCEEVKKAKVVGQILKYEDGVVVQGQEATFMADEIELKD